MRYRFKVAGYADVESLIVGNGFREAHAEARRAQPDYGLFVEELVRRCLPKKAGTQGSSEDGETGLGMSADHARDAMVKQSRKIALTQLNLPFDNHEIPEQPIEALLREVDRLEPMSRIDGQLYRTRDAVVCPRLGPKLIAIWAERSVAFRIESDHAVRLHLLMADIRARCEAAVEAAE